MLKGFITYKSMIGFSTLFVLALCLQVSATFGSEMCKDYRKDEFKPNAVIRALINEKKTPDEVINSLYSIARESYLDKPKKPTSIRGAFDLLLGPYDYTMVVLDELEEQTLGESGSLIISEYLETSFADVSQAKSSLGVLKQKVTAKLMNLVATKQPTRDENNQPLQIIQQLRQLLATTQPSGFNKNALKALELTTAALWDLDKRLSERPEIEFGPVLGSSEILFRALHILQCPNQELFQFPAVIKERLLPIIDIMFKRYDHAPSTDKEKFAMKNLIYAINQNLLELQQQAHESELLVGRGVPVSEVEKHKEVLESWIDFEAELLQRSFAANSLLKSARVFDLETYWVFIKMRVKVMKMNSFDMSMAACFDRTKGFPINRLRELFLKAPRSKRLWVLECLLDMDTFVLFAERGNFHELFKLVIIEPLSTYEYLAFEKAQVSRYNNIQTDEDKILGPLAREELRLFGDALEQKKYWQGDYYEDFQDFLQNRNRLHGAKKPELAIFLVLNFIFSKGEVTQLRFDFFHEEARPFLIALCIVFQEKLLPVFETNESAEAIQEWLEERLKTEIGLELRSAQLQTLLSKTDEAFRPAEEANIETQAEAFVLLLSSGFTFRRAQDTANMGNALKGKENF